jgi:hypothetical protein
MNNIRKNKYGHIVSGKTNIKNLWYSRDVIVSVLNSLTIMRLTLDKSKVVKKIDRIIKMLKVGLLEVDAKLGIPKKADNQLKKNIPKKVKGGEDDKKYSCSFS